MIRDKKPLSPQSYSERPLTFAKWQQDGNGDGCFELAQDILDSSVFSGRESRPATADDVIAVNNYSGKNITAKVYLKARLKSPTNRERKYTAEELADTKPSVIMDVSKQQLGQLTEGINFSVFLSVVQENGQNRNDTIVASREFQCDNPMDGLSISVIPTLNMGVTGYKFCEGSDLTSGHLKVKSQLSSSRHVIKVSMYRNDAPVALEENRIKYPANMLLIEFPYRYAIILDSQNQQTPAREEELIDTVYELTRGQFLGLFVGDTPGSFDPRVLDKSVHPVCFRGR